MKDRQRWQPEEDSLLRSYVKQYGPKEWNLISQRMAKPIHRDPKSCLERWKNYLKPGLKKGSLSPDEQSLVISLQSKYGNKWKKIAAEVPGRTAKRLGKWWEVFKEKQLKQIQKSQNRRDFHNSDNPTPEKALHGPYDHILETFAEKYVHVQPKLSMMGRVPDSDPVLSLGSVNSTTSSSTVIPMWMNTSTASSSTPSTTPSPSVSLTLSPSEPVAFEPELNRVLPVQQIGTLIQYCKELDEGRQNWLQHKKEATWRLNRLEQQLESEKSRKRREKMEEMEEQIRSLREEEMEFFGRIERDYRDQIQGLQREEEIQETKLLESWGSKHVKLGKVMEKIRVYGYGFAA